jgi:RNA polymerase sigma factor (sigma-70 family)
MATAQMDAVIRHLRRAVLRQDEAAWTDGQLLGSFIDQKDEAAFEALVRRHGPMVFGVCRRVVGNHHDAEDAFQATFLVLARKASSVRPRERVANWLHGVALRTAMKAKTITAKRRGREKQVTEMPEAEAAQQDQWRDLQPLLDQELNSLPDNYRLPILLCYVEGKTIKIAAQQLGWPQGSLAGRLARGRKLLAKRLASRGVMLSAGSLAALVSQNVASAGVPTSLMSSTIKAATMIAAGQASVAGLVPAKVAALMEGMLKTTLINKLKTVTAIVLLLGLMASGAAVVTSQSAAAQSEKSPISTQRDKLSSGATQLDGTWIVVDHLDNGRRVPSEKFSNAKHQLVIKGDSWTEICSETVLEYAMTLDPLRRPPHINLFHDFRWNHGIYELLTDNTLIDCCTMPGKPRPTEFTAKAGSNRSLTVYKRLAENSSLHKVREAEDRGTPKANTSSEELRPVTKQELATVVPNCFAVNYGPTVWLRVDDAYWIERYRDGSESKYKTLGRTKVRGRPGILVAKVGGDTKRTGNGNDGRFQVFIPDKTDSPADVLFRHLGLGDESWFSLSPVRSAE